MVDEDYMNRALSLAERGRGRTSPNPLVGAVVVSRDGVIVGQGFHRRVGEPHAEIHALEEAGDLARTLHIHPSTLTGILQRLAERGLLRRIAHPDDARRVQLELTPKGKRLTAPGGGAVESAVKRVLAKFDAADVQGARDLLMALATGLETERDAEK